MAEERIDIVVSEVGGGSRVVKRNLEEMGASAQTSSTALEKLQGALASITGAVDRVKGVLDNLVNVFVKLVTSLNTVASNLSKVTTSATATATSSDKLAVSAKTAATGNADLATSAGRAAAAIQAQGESAEAQTLRLRAMIAATAGTVNANNGVVESARSLAERAGIRITQTEEQRQATMRAVAAQNAQWAANIKAATAAEAETVVVKTNTVAHVENTAAAKLSSNTTRELGTTMGELAAGNSGRLKQSMASLANSTGLLTKLMTPLGFAIMGVVGILALFSLSLIKGWQEAIRMNREVLALGGMAGDSGSAFDGLARQVQSATTTLTEGRQAISAVAQTGKVAFGDLANVGQGVANMAFLTGDSIESLSGKMSGLGTETSKTILDLNQQYGLFNNTIYDQVRALENQGNQAEAARIAAQALADETHERVQKAVEDMGTLERAITSLKSHWDTFTQLVRGIGSGTLQAELDQSYLKLGQAEGQVESTNNLAAKALGLHWLAQQRLNKVMEENVAIRAKVNAEADSAQQAATDSQANKDALAANARIQDRLETLGKVNVLQRQLNKNVEDYTKLWNDAQKTGKIPEALKGVKFENGQFSGGSFDQTVAGIKERYAPKPRRGLTDAEKEARKEAAYMKELESALDRYSGRSSEATRAQNDLTNAQKVFNAAVSKGLITQDQANQYMEQLRQRTRDALDPLGALNRKIDERTRLLKMGAEQSQVEAELMQDIQQLQGKGQLLTQKDIEQLRAKITAQQELTRIMQIQDQLQRNSGAGRAKEQARTNTAVGNLLNDSSSGYNKDDAFKDMSAGLPQDIFAGTKEATKQNALYYKQMYAQIDEMRQADVISTQSAVMAKISLFQQEHASQIAGVSQMFGNLATLQSSHNKKAAAVGKAAAIAQATMDTAQAAIAAYKSVVGIPYVGPFLAVAAAGAAIVAGTAQIAKIRSTNYGGYAYGGGFEVGGAGGTDSQQVSFRATPGERVTINTPSQARALEDAAKRRPEEGGKRRGDFHQTVNVVVQGRPNRQTEMQQARAIRRETMREYSRS